MTREKTLKEKRATERKRGEGLFGKAHQYHKKCLVEVDITVCNSHDKWLKTYNSTRRKPFRETFEEIIRHHKSFPATFEEIVLNPRSENLTAEDFEDNGKRKKKKKKKRKQKNEQRADTEARSEAQQLAEQCRGGSDQNKTLTDLISLLPNPPFLHVSHLESGTEGYPGCNTNGVIMSNWREDGMDRSFAEDSIELK